MKFLLDVPRESGEMKRTELIGAPLSQSCSPPSHQPQVSGLLARSLTTQVGHTQTILGHLLHCRDSREHSNSLNLRAQHVIMVEH